MQPQPNAPNTLNLPPVPETNYPSLPGAEHSAASPEAATQAPEVAPASTATVPLPAVPTPYVPPVFSAAPANDVSTTTDNQSPSLADDGDLIEKEWVVKAKQIVNQTHDNPHEQNKAMTSLKVDYLQKRYQKTIKMSD